MNEHPGNTSHTHAPRPPLLVTIPQAAELLAVGRSTVYQLIWDHELEPIRIGRCVRLTIDDLEDYVQRKRAA
ncbi:MAG: helix-turn-helix domain-containing protein [Ilumatobacteraceae bacterium]